MMSACRVMAQNGANPAASTRCTGASRRSSSRASCSRASSAYAAGSVRASPASLTVRVIGGLLYSGVLVPEHPLEELAGGVAGQVGAEGDGPGALVVGEVVAAVGDQLGAELRSRVRHRQR